MGKPEKNTGEEYVLFSPLGMTDPISQKHDGPMLHIARIYKPKIIYLYMSAEICDRSEKDDRYRQAIKKLEEHTESSFEVRPIERRKLYNPHISDEVYKDFEEIIGNIKKEHPCAKILLNVTSGTPAMQHALNSIAVMSDDIICFPIQVSAPEKKFEKNKEYTYDLDSNWDSNDDNNTGGFKNRTSPSDNYELVKRLEKMIICKHIDAYDYAAALRVAGKAAGIPWRAWQLIKAADARTQINTSGVDKEIKSDDPCRALFAPEEASGIRNISEYLCLLELELEKKEYFSFILRISPIFFDLLVKLLEKNSVNIMSYCEKESTKTYLKKYKLEKDDSGNQILQILKSEKNISDKMLLNSAILVPIARAIPKINNEVRKNIEALRICEERCRNVAAHDIVSVKDDWIRKECGMKPNNILAGLRRLASEAGIHVEKLKDSYKAINEQIKKELSE